jgi:hypothetical protein
MHEKMHRDKRACRSHSRLRNERGLRFEMRNTFSWDWQLGRCSAVIGRLHKQLGVLIGCKSSGVRIVLFRLPDRPLRIGTIFKLKINLSWAVQPDTDV